MRLMDRVVDAAARRHLAANTIECDSRWVREFLAFCRVDGRWREPREFRGAEVSAFLTHLAVGRGSGRSTQTRATNAIVFLYRDVLADELEAGRRAGDGPRTARGDSRVVTPWPASPRGRRHGHIAELGATRAGPQHRSGRGRPRLTRELTKPNPEAIVVGREARNALAEEHDAPLYAPALFAQFDFLHFKTAKPLLKLGTAEPTGTRVAADLPVELQHVQRLEDPVATTHVRDLVPLVREVLAWGLAVCRRVVPHVLTVAA